jgi:hypothetical protein
MALRRQTFALFALLAGVVLLAVLHRPSAPAEESSPSAFSAPTAAAASAALAKLRSPKGFRTTDDCQPPGATLGSVCFLREPSQALSEARFSTVVRETGLTAPDTVDCLDSRRYFSRPRLTLQACLGRAWIGDIAFDVGLTSVVLAHGQARIGTRRALGSGPAELQGTSYMVSELGIERGYDGSR